MKNGLKKFVYTLITQKSEESSYPPHKHFIQRL